MESYLYPVKEG